METFTALLEATPYAWFTFLAFALGGVGALATIPARRRRYPAIFRRRRSILVLLLLLIAALTVPFSLFLPGPHRLPSLGDTLFFVLPLIAVSALLFRWPRVGVPVLLLLIALLVGGSTYAVTSYRFPEEGAAIVSVDVTAVKGDSLELFIEFPGASADRLLSPAGEPAFRLPVSGTTLTIRGETVHIHPYLWWFQPSAGLRLTGIDETAELRERLARLGAYQAPLLEILERSGAIRRFPYQVGRENEELLLAGYELVLIGDEPILRRRLRTVPAGRVR